MNDPTKVKIQSNCANAPEGGFLDTLAQLRKNPNLSTHKEGEEGVKRLQKRARAKYAQTPLILSLVDEAERAGDFTMRDSYWNTFHCVGYLEQKGDKISGKYCNNRWCLVCSRIRTGKLINKYSPYFEQMQEPQFVTLTAPTVTEQELPYRLEEMQRQLKQCQEILRKAGTPLKGIRKIEIQYNSETNKYHPHYHLIIEGEYESTVLLDLWLSKNKNSDIKGQNIQSADFNSMIELFKYTTKLCSKDVLSMNPYSLNIIFRSLRGLRTFQSIGGFGRGEVENDDSINPKQTEVYTHIEESDKRWYWKGNDWKDVHEKPLSGYEPSEAIEQFRNNLEQCSANNVTENLPQRTTNRNTVQTDADNERFMPVKRPYKRPLKKAIQTKIQV